MFLPSTYLAKVLFHAEGTSVSSDYTGCDKRSYDLMINNRAVMKSVENIPSEYGNIRLQSVCDFSLHRTSVVFMYRSN